MQESSLCIYFVKDLERHHIKVKIPFSLSFFQELYCVERECVYIYDIKNQTFNGVFKYAQQKDKN
jgi:hypothetical protein